MSSTSNHDDEHEKTDQSATEPYNPGNCNSDVSQCIFPVRPGNRYRPNIRTSRHATSLNGSVYGSLSNRTKSWARISRGGLVRNETCTLPRTSGQHHRSRLRDSLGDIAQELRKVDHISSSLCNSFHEDLARAGARSFLVYEQVRARQELTGSIVDSYDLDDQSDTYSYVSNHLMTVRSQVPAQFANNNGGYHTDAESSLGTPHRSSSSESLSTLGNDRYYPSVVHGKFGKRTRRAKKLGRRNSWKREARPKIYTVFAPKHVETTNTARAGVRMLYDEGTYV